MSLKNLNFKKLLILVAQLACFLSMHAQTYSISGIVRNKHTTETIAGANIYLSGTTIGTTSNVNGYFQLQVSDEQLNLKLICSFIGYKTDTIPLTDLKRLFNFNLEMEKENLREVVVSGTMKEITKLESPIPVEIYTPAFFKKNPSPNIFESLNMVNGVQPQLNCNVCNTGDIRINGMEGPYTMVLIDGMPIVSSLATVYGLAGIPNSIVNRIEVVKGPASALYGSEAVGGLINIITKNPASIPKLNIDLSGTTWKEFNLDISSRYKFKKTYSLLGINAFIFNSIYDKNKDGFTDVTLQKRISVFNKWAFKNKLNKPNNLAVRYIYEDRWGGQTGWTSEWRGTDSIYGESIYSNRAELFGVYNLPTIKQNIRLEYAYNFHLQDSYYGTIKYYALQHTAFAQVLWDKTIKSHSLLFGFPFRFISYDDNSPATATPDTVNSQNAPSITCLPGIFIQDEWAFHKKLSTLIGIRYDYNTQHGNIITPRLSLKFRPVSNHTFRLSTGTGYRVVNLFTEDHAALTGARQVVLNEKLNPEQSWNVNLNYVTHINYKKGFITLDASAFYTHFSNQIVGDFYTDPNKIIYGNLMGHAISKGITLNTDFSFTNGLKWIVGGTFLNVYQVAANSFGFTKKSPHHFVPKFQSTFSLSYTIPKTGLGIDLTGNLKSPMYLPILPNDFRPEKSPWYCLLNLQLTKKLSEQIELYTGIKNILNFKPENPIMRAFDPFDKDITVNNPNNYTFDTSYSYAPIQGIKVNFGFRWSID